MNINNAKQLINSIEAFIELKELKQLGLDDEEIAGFLEIFYNIASNDVPDKLD
jgi:hypothetical protein